MVPKKWLQEINIVTKITLTIYKKIAAGNYYPKIEADKKVTTLKFLKE